MTRHEKPDAWVDAKIVDFMRRHGGGARRVTLRGIRRPDATVPVYFGPEDLPQTVDLLRALRWIADNPNDPHDVHEVALNALSGVPQRLKTREEG